MRRARLSTCVKTSTEPQQSEPISRRNEDYRTLAVPKAHFGGCLEGEKPRGFQLFRFWKAYRVESTRNGGKCSSYRVMNSFNV